MNRERTFWQLVEDRAEATPDALFAIDERDRSLDFAGYRDAALRCAAGLQNLGVGAGTPVSWMLPSTLEAMVLCGALARLGAVQNPILPIYRERETGFILGQTGARLVCVPSVFRGFDYAAMARSVAAECEGLEVLVVDDSLPEADPVGLPPAPKPAGLQDAPVRWILYTSGTTSDPKGAQHTDAGLIAAFTGMASAFDLGPDDRHAMAFPITHVGGVGWMIAGLLTGCAQIAMPVFDPEHTIPVLASHGVTQAGAGTAFHQAFLAAQRAEPGEPLFSRIRTFPGGGAPKPPQLHYDMKRELGGVGIVSGYGLTECPVVAMNRVGDPDEKLAETEGRANPPETEIRVVRGDGTRAGAGEEGELRVRAPQLFRGYLDASLDAEAFDSDGFFRTGDLGCLDDDGFVTVTGRLKDVIIRKGENISAREIEDLLYTHPKVADVAVIGLPDPNLGERCCAVVACRDEPLGFEEMVEFLKKQRLARQKLPEQLELVDSVPRNASGKIEKRALREHFAPDQREQTVETVAATAREGGSGSAGGVGLEDRVAVIDTVNRYATALDSRDWDLLDEVFTPDAVGDFGGGVLTGREALRDLMRRSVGRGGPSQHLLGNHRVELGRDTASCVCQVRAFSAGTGPTAGQSYELIGEYRDQLVRTPDGWRIARREMTIHHEIGSRDVLKSVPASVDSHSA